MAGTIEVARATVTIVPNMKGAQAKITQELGGENVGKETGKKIGGGIAGSLKTALIAAGIGKVVKESLEAGGALQQSFGGLDTIYGEAADSMKAMAAEAATAGISMNDYAEQAVSFGASLKQAFGDDIEGAAQAANTAIMDMADNSAKMGTDIANIQSAYQGFAKQNYTMLDNLKLGYGGTKTEMERLLADAKELSGVEYNIDNLGDVYAAIHVIQEDLGLTGVAAQEASETFSGSFNAMKATATNLLAVLTTGGDVSGALQQMGTSISAFINGNLLPMLGNLGSQIPTILDGVFNAIIAALPGAFSKISELLPQLIQSATNLIVNLAGHISEIIQPLISALPQVITALINGLITAIPALVKAGADLFRSVKDGLVSEGPGLIDSLKTILSDLKTEITNNLPEWLDAGIDFVMEMADGILSGLPEIISVAGDLLDGFINFILDNLDVILEKGIELVLKLTEGIISALPKIAESTGKVISKLLTTISGKLPDILRMGVTLIGKLIAGLVKQAPELLKSFGEILKSLWDAVTSIDWLQLGKDILAGIGKGLKEGLGAVLDAAKEAGASIKNKFKEFFGIESPSKVMRDEVGVYLSEGIAEGIDDGKGKIERTLRGLTADITTGFDARLAIAGDVPMGASSYVFNNNITVDGAQDPEAWTQGFLRTLKREARMTNGN